MKSKKYLFIVKETW